MRGLCQRAWLLLVLVVGLLTWHIRPHHGRVVVDTHPSRDHTIPAGSPGAAAVHAHSLPQQHGRASEPRAAAEEVPEWATDHEPRTRSLLRVGGPLCETRAADGGCAAPYASMTDAASEQRWKYVDEFYAPLEVSRTRR